MTTYNIDWEGAYDAWKQSGLPRRRFQYSDLFKTFIGEGAMPSEDTVRTRFRSVRDQRGDHSPTTNITVAENDQPPVTLDLSEPIKIEASCISVGKTEGVEPSRSRSSYSKGCRREKGEMPEPQN